MNLDQLKSDLIRDEGIKNKPYKDRDGNTTIGIGRNLDANGLSKDEIYYLFNNDINEAISEISTIPGYDSLSEGRQRVLAEMCFNMGIQRLCEFHRLLAAIDKGDIEAAHGEILDSDAARELPARYSRLADLWLNG